jgi:hypothetical protein
MIDQFISKSEDLCGLIMKMTILAGAIGMLYPRQTGQTKVMIFLTHLQGSVRSSADEIVRKWDAMESLI